MSKHWFIAHLIEEFTKNKKFGLDIGIGQDNWKNFKKCRMIGVDRMNSKADIVVDLENGIPFKENTFDIIIAINSLNYIRNSYRLLTDINKIIKKDGVLVCVVDNENSKCHPNVWTQKYLNRILKVTGFKSILTSNLRDYFYANWFNLTSVYGFAVVKKGKEVDEEKGKEMKITQSIKFAKSYSVKTTHPEN